MRVLIACEFSGIVREAFAARGHDAWSCDLIPTEIPGNHYLGHIFEFLRNNPVWDLMIFHWPCTRLCNSGVRWLYAGGKGKTPDVDRRKEMLRDADSFVSLLNWPDIAKIAGENPIPHRYALEIMGNYTQIIQPWQFGHGETKATCLWLKDLPKLVPTNIVSGRNGRVWKEPPSPDRWKNRSRTYQGIADAMAEQWGAL